MHVYPPGRRWLVLLLGAATAVATGQAPVSGETLLFSPPADFKVGYSARHDNTAITEFVPNGQSVDDWAQMLTVQVFHGATVDPATFLGGLGARYTHACPGTSAKGIFTGQSNGYVVSMLLLRCPNNPATGKPETTAFRVIKGKDALYSVQHAWRAVTSDQEVEAAMHALATVIVCDTRTPEHDCRPPEAAASPSGS
jgi:hypothetical protein